VIAELIFAIIGLISLGITVWQFIVAMRFSLHSRIACKKDFPSVTILKPVKGVDEFSNECLSSWMKQEYSGRLQIIFGVDSKNDPAFNLCSELIKTFPKIDAQVVVCEGMYGSNSKVSKLVHLTQYIKNEFVIVSDADVLAPTDLLQGSIGVFENEEIGLVCCCYTLANPDTLAMKLEAVAINSDFWSQVLQARSMKPLNFAFGAVMMIRRKALEKIGGFNSVVNRLADDYWLGRLVFENGYKVELSPVVVECYHRPTGWRETLSHQLRWARTIRVCEPLSYFFSILSNLNLWAALFLILFPSILSMVFFAIAIFTRSITAALHQKKLTRTKIKLWHFVMPVIKDVIQFIIWILSFTGNTVEWREKKYKITSDGIMIPIESKQ
jgi:ceramide glucosyltransferase